MKDLARARFYTQLARLLDSGIAPGQALEMLGQEGAVLARSLRQGQSLSGAWRRHSGFGEMEGWVVEAGEDSGELSTCLEDLAEHFERRATLRRRMFSKLLYPTVLLHAVFLLPALGLLLVEGLAAYLRVAVAPLVLAWSLLAFGGFLVRRVRSSAAGALAFDRGLLRVPVVGSIVRDRALAAYGRGLALLLRAGLPLLGSLGRAARMVPNRWFRRKAESIELEVRKGSSLAASMAASFPSVFVEMIRVGEASGRLDDQLDAASRYFDQEGQTAVARLAMISSSLAFLLVAVVVGAVVIRSWLAIMGR